MVSVMAPVTAGQPVTVERLVGPVGPVSVVKAPGAVLAVERAAGKAVLREVVALSAVVAALIARTYSPRVQVHPLDSEQR
jgi:hypothetical protein